MSIVLLLVNLVALMVLFLAKKAQKFPLRPPSQHQTADRHSERLADEHSLAAEESDTPLGSW